MDNFQKRKQTHDLTLVKLLEADSDLAIQAAALANQMEALQEKRRSLQSVIKLFDSTKTSVAEDSSTGQSLLDLFSELTADMTEDEIAQLPKDGAEQHDYYIYGTPKRQL